MKSISIFGLGYVGSVTAACFASQCHRVCGVDANPSKVQTVQKGRSPIVEKDVDRLLAEAVRNGKLTATTDPTEAVLNSEISFVCVGTPSRKNGRLDLGHIQTVSREIGTALKAKKGFHTVVLRSTMLPGTAEEIVTPEIESASGKQAGTHFAVCVNPEFMREGTAVADFLEPAITVLGATLPALLKPLEELYAWVPGKVFRTSIREAEMVKYCCNAFHAVKVSFANEVGTLCKEMEIDPEAVTEIFLADTRLNISPAYLKPGFAFGGSCLPKDVRALTYRAKELDLKLPLMESLLPSNQQHIDRAVQAVLSTGKKTIGFLGLSFKAGTDDLRESPQVQMIKQLLGEGCHVQVWDDQVSLGKLIGTNRQYIESVIPHIGLLLRPELKDVIDPAEVVVVGTRSVRREVLDALLQPEQIVLDLVNIEKSRRVARARAVYAGICWQ